MSDEFEELEQIPWSALATKAPDMRLRLAAVAVAVVVLLIVGVFFVSGRQPTPAAGDATAASDTTGFTDEVSVTTRFPSPLPRPRIPRPT